MNIILAEIDDRMADDFSISIGFNNIVLHARTVGDVMHHLLHNRIEFIITSFNLELLKDLDDGLGMLLNENINGLQLWVIRDDIKSILPHINGSGFKLPQQVIARKQLGQMLQQAKIIENFS